jgi:hypothetical protein
MLIISCSKLSRAPALELYATAAVTVKLILTLVTDPLIRVLSRYGVPGTITQAGGIIASGTEL